jgi:hypothetical protein
LSYGRDRGLAVHAVGQIAPDGHWYGCYEPDDCDPLSICAYGICEPVPALSVCSPNSESSIPLAVDDAPLALSFVDVDADGAAELVVATQTELHVFESGSNVATVSARVVESPSVQAMVAGAFDANPGQDLSLLVDDTLLMHPSDGIAGFEVPSEGASPLQDGVSMLVGEFDGLPLSDRMVWGSNGASLIAGSVTMIQNGSVTSATAVDLDSGSGRFVLQTWDWMFIYALDGSSIVDFGIDGFSDVGVMISLVAAAESLDLGATVYETWTMLDMRELQQSRGRWGVNGTVSAMVGGDLDGDGSDEVALLLDGGVTLIDELASGRECTQPLELAGLTDAAHLAIGDWDGDGDDELAVAFASGEIAVFDEG